MSVTVNRTQCCGIRELHGISGAKPKEAVMDFANYFINKNDSRFSLVTFTSNDGVKGYGNRLKNYIEKHKLGHVTMSRCVVNPNTSRKIRCFIWEFYPEALKKWYEPELAKEKKAMAKLLGMFKIGDKVTINPKFSHLVYSGNNFVSEYGTSVTAKIQCINKDGVGLVLSNGRGWHYYTKELKYLMLCK